MRSVNRPFRARRRTPFKVLASLSIFLLLLAGCSSSEAASSKMAQAGEEAASVSDRPNIIFVLADDLDYASVQKMPELRTVMVEEGVSFGNFFTSQSLCCPSRATSFTGLYAHNHQIKGNKPQTADSRSSETRGWRRTRSPPACNGRVTGPPSWANT